MIGSLHFKSVQELKSTLLHHPVRLISLIIFPVGFEKRISSVDEAGACRPGQCADGALQQRRWWQDLQTSSAWRFATNSILNKVLQLCKESSSEKSQTSELSSTVNTQVMPLIFAPFHTEM